jgi:SAM-dependent methyltransferase
MKSLREIFYSQQKFADKWDPYFDVYETWLSRFCGRSPRILEIGVQNGGSANMWLEYFGPGTTVLGIDIDPRCLQHASDSIEILIGDQGSPDFWENFLNTRTDRFDIVIDDGGHRMQEMMLTFMAVSQLVDAGGIYLIEDTHTAYWSHSSLFGPPHGDFGLGNPNNILECTKDAVDVLNREHIEPHADRIPQLDPLVTDLYKDVRGLHYYNSMIVFEMGPQAPFSRCLNSGIKMQAD